MTELTLINDSFPMAKGFKTERNARLKLEQAFNAGHFLNCPCAVIKRPDGQYLPIVFCTDRKDSFYNIPALCSRGICVTN